MHDTAGVGVVVQQWLQSFQPNLENTDEKLLLFSNSFSCRVHNTHQPILNLKRGNERKKENLTSCSTVSNPKGKRRAKDSMNCIREFGIASWFYVEDTQMLQ